MACADRQWCDFVSFDPRMPDNLHPCSALYIQLVELNVKDKGICLQLALESEVAAAPCRSWTQDVKALLAVGESK
jgi:hypothetical protein